MKIDLETLKQNSPEDLIKLKNFIDEYLHIQDKLRFVYVEINNRDGRELMSALHKAFPKYYISWDGEPGTIGTFYIEIPRADWNDELKEKISKFDSFVGHHTQTAHKYVLKKNMSFPPRVQTIIDNRIDMLSKLAVRAGKAPTDIGTVAWTLSEVERDYELRGLAPIYFDKVEYVAHEWDDKLIVNDSFDYANRQLEDLKKISIELK